MTQYEVDCAVADVTGETLSDVRRMGFSIADPSEVNFDPEPDDLLPQAIDWDVVDLERNSPVIHQMHRSLRSVA
jgi:hypothetical protein